MARAKGRLPARGGAAPQNPLDRALGALGACRIAISMSDFVQFGDQSLGQSLKVSANIIRLKGKQRQARHRFRREKRQLTAKRVRMPMPAPRVMRDKDHPCSGQSKRMNVCRNPFNGNASGKHQ
jgi:hypothetical protein